MVLREWGGGRNDASADLSMGSKAGTSPSRPPTHFLKTLAGPDQSSGQWSTTPGISDQKSASGGSWGQDGVRKSTLTKARLQPGTR